MRTALQEVQAWEAEGRTQGATHLIVVCDTFDHEDYPVFVKPTQEVEQVRSKYESKSMQRIMEVIAL